MRTRTYWQPQKKQHVSKFPTSGILRSVNYGSKNDSTAITVRLQSYRRIRGSKLEVGANAGKERIVEKATRQASQRSTRYLTHSEPHCAFYVCGAADADVAEEGR